MSARNQRFIAIAAIVAFSFLLNVHVFADLAKLGNKKAPPQSTTQQPISGQLATVRQAKILVNGNITPSGATIFSGSQLQTPESVGAAIMVGSLGRVDIAPKTTLVVTFTSETMEIDLTAGCVILSTEKGISGLVKTPQGVNQKIGPEKLSFIDVCTGESGAASPIIGEGAAMRAGAGVCWAVGQPFVLSSGFNPLWLLPAPIVGAAIVTTTDGRPDTVSASSPGL
jgi:hypothetical protein